MQNDRPMVACGVKFPYAPWRSVPPRSSPSVTALMNVLTPPNRIRRSVLAALLATTLCSVAPPARADDGPPIPVDGVRPPSMPGLLRAWPLAIHAAPGTSADTLRDTLAAARSLLDQLHYRFGLPDPAPDGTRGGGPELDVYLVRPAARDAPAGDTIIDALETSALWDRATTFITLRNDLDPDARDRALAETLTRAVMLSIDARIPRPFAIAAATTYAERLTGQRLDPDAVVAFQRTADAALLRDRDDLSARGAALFTDYLAQHFDTPDLRGLRGLLWMPVAYTPPERDHFVPAPHLFDCLERTVRGEPAGFYGVIADFTLARGLIGTRGDQLGFPGIGPDPEDPALRPQPWLETSLAALPAWITPTRVLDETGAAFVAIDTRGAGHAALSVFFHGVPWRRWMITIARLADDGTLAGVIPRSSVLQGDWHAVIENLDHVARLLVVVNDLGNGNLDPYEGPSRNGFFAVHIDRR